MYGFYLAASNVTSPFSWSPVFLVGLIVGMVLMAFLKR